MIKRSADLSPWMMTNDKGATTNGAEAMVAARDVDRLYEFVKSNPLTFTDPLGLWGVCGPHAPHWGSIDVHCCTIGNRLVNACCSTAQIAAGSACCRRKNKCLKSGYCPRGSKWNNFICEDCRWKCFCPLPGGNLRTECQFHNFNKKDCRKTKCCTTTRIPVYCDAYDL